jgi:hypothetical protein
MKNLMSACAHDEAAKSKVNVVGTCAMLKKLLPLFAKSLCALRYEREKGAGSDDVNAR